MPKKKKWVKKALKVRPRRRGLRATGYTPKLRRHRQHVKSVRVEAAHKGALHRWAGVPLDHKFTAVELTNLERRARHELKHAHAAGDKYAQGRALHDLRMVLFARRVRGFKHRGYKKQSRDYKGRR